MMTPQLHIVGSNAIVARRRLECDAPMTRAAARST
jgi:hypothetical protein